MTLSYIQVISSCINKPVELITVFLSKKFPETHHFFRKIKKKVGILLPKPIRIYLIFLRSKPNLIDFDGHSIWINEFNDIRKYLIKEQAQDFEEKEVERVKRVIKRGDTVLDIGANVGYYTLLMARLVGDTGKVYAFEPDPLQFYYLKKNVIKNGYRNVVLVNKAVSDHNGTGHLFLCDLNTGNHKIYDCGRNREYIDVDTVTLDALFPNREKNIGFIKIDVEGAEPAVINGMERLIDKHDHLEMITEFNPLYLRDFGTGPVEYLNLLREKDFVIYDINGKSVGPATNGDLLDKYDDDIEINFTNLYCIKTGAT